MSGPHTKQLSMTLMMIFCTWMCYFVVFVPFMECRYSFKIGLFMSSLNFVLLVVTAFTDPGILPSEIKIIAHFLLLLLDISVFFLTEIKGTIMNGSLKSSLFLK